MVSMTRHYTFMEKTLNGIMRTNSSSKMVIKLLICFSLCLVKHNSCYLNTETCLILTLVKTITLDWSISLGALNKTVLILLTGMITITISRDTFPSRRRLVVRFYNLTVTKSKAWVIPFLKISKPYLAKSVWDLIDRSSKRQRFGKNVRDFTRSAKVMKRSSKDFWSLTISNWSILTT